MSIVLCVWRRSWKRSPLGEELREVDHPAAPVLGRPEITAGMHIFMHHNELRVYLVDSPTPSHAGRGRRDRVRILRTSPHRIPVETATTAIKRSYSSSRSPTARIVRRSTATPTRIGRFWPARRCRTEAAGAGAGAGAISPSARCSRPCRANLVFGLWSERLGR
jgi:hypothetical protein